MWLQRFTNYVLRYRWQTILLAFVVTFIPVIGIMGVLIAAFVTLHKSIVEGAILTVAATLPYIISFYVSGNHDVAVVPLVVWAALGVAVSSNVLTWVFAVMLRRQTSWSLILQIAALLGVLIISVIHLAYPEIVNWWGNQLQYYYTRTQAMTSMLKPETANQSEMQLEAINITKQYATGLMVTAVLFNAILQLILARWWQAIMFSRGNLRRELHSIRLSQLAGILFVACLALSYLGNSVVLDIMPVLYMLFGVVGLSLVHYFFGLMTSQTVWFWLALFYVMVIFAMPTSMVLIAMLALIDIWLDARKRIRKI